MKRIHFNLTRAGVVGAIAALSLSAPAFANTAEDISVCETALAQHVEALGGTADEAKKFKFKRISGGGMKTITFSAKLGGDSKRVKCKVKRSEVVDILNDNGESVFKAKDE